MNALVDSVEQEVTKKASLLVKSNKYLTFLQKEETFAVDISAVKEIIEYKTLTKVPLMPQFVRGVLNLRGNVVPVIDLSKRLGGEVSVTNRRSCIVIIEVDYRNEKIDIGMLVDTISEMLEIPALDVDITSHLNSNIRPDFVINVQKINGELIVLLNANAVLSIEEIGELAYQ